MSLKRSRSSNEDPESNDGLKHQRLDDADSMPSMFEDGGTNDNDSLFKIEDGADFGSSTWNLSQEPELHGPKDAISFADVADVTAGVCAGVTNTAPTDSDQVSTAGSETSSVDEDSTFEELFAAVMTASDDNGRSVSQIFQLLPSKDDYPDYYEFIKEPIDLKMIGTKVQTNAYQTLTDLEKDLMLMVKNAKFYNEPGSQVYKDANFIRKVIIAKKAEIEQRKYQPHAKSRDRGDNRQKRIKKAYIPHESGQKWSAVAAALKYDAVETAIGNQSYLESAEDEDGNDSDPEDATENPMYVLFDLIRNYKDDQGNMICGPFMRLPNRRYWPDYYQEIKNPISLSQIQTRIKQNWYRRPTLLIEDLNLMFENAKKYNRPDSKIYENTCLLQSVMYAKAKELFSFEKSPHPETLDDPEEDDEDEDDDDDDEADGDGDADDLDETSKTIPDLPELKLEDIKLELETSQSKSLLDGTENEESNDTSFLNVSTSSSITSTPSGTSSGGLSVTIKKKIAKRLVTGYILFASEVRKSVVQANPDCNFGDISRIIGTEWKNLSNELKEEYEKKAKKQNEITQKDAQREAELNPMSPSQLKQVIQNAVYECHWEHKCDFQCEDTNDLFDHLTSEPLGHVWKSYGAVKDKEESIFQCLFHGCGRVKKGAAPFPSVARLIRHIKEVHVTKQAPKSIPPEKRGKNFHPSKTNPHPYIFVTDSGDSSISPSPLKTYDERIYQCLWEKQGGGGYCDYQFEDAPDLLDHLIGEPHGHVSKTYGDIKDKEDGAFQCLFQNCGRVKKGAPPFPNYTRLMRHVKEIHVTKQTPKPIPYEKRTKNFIPGKNSIHLHPPPSSAPVVITPPTTAPTHIVIQAPAPPPVQKTSVGVQVEQMEPLFMKPQTPRLFHSSAYLKYVERLKPETRHVCNWESQLNATPENTTTNPANLPVDWLANGSGAHGNVVNALWALRNFMFRDCLTLARNNDK